MHGRLLGLSEWRRRRGVPEVTDTKRNNTEWITCPCPCDCNDLYRVFDGQEQYARGYMLDLEVALADLRVCYGLVCNDLTESRAEVAALRERLQTSLQDACDLNSSKACLAALTPKEADDE